MRAPFLCHLSPRWKEGFSIPYMHTLRRTAALAAAALVRRWCADACLRVRTDGRYTCTPTQIHYQTWIVWAQPPSRSIPFGGIARERDGNGSCGALKWDGAPERERGAREASPRAPLPQFGRKIIFATHTGAVSEPESSSQTPWPGSTAFGIIQKDTFDPRRALARSQREILIYVDVCVRMRPIDTVSKIENAVFYSRRGMSRKVLLLNYITRCQNELNWTWTVREDHAMIYVTIFFI